MRLYSFRYVQDEQGSAIGQDDDGDSFHDKDGRWSRFELRLNPDGYINIARLTILTYRNWTQSSIGLFYFRLIQKIILARFNATFCALLRCNAIWYNDHKFNRVDRRTFFDSENILYNQQNYHDKTQDLVRIDTITPRLKPEFQSHRESWWWKRSVIYIYKTYTKASYVYWVKYKEYWK